MSGMYLNLCRCNIKVADTATISSTPFVDKEWLKNLRERHSDYSFLRKGDNVFFWPKKDGAAGMEMFNSISTETLTKDRHPFIIVKMIEDKIVEFFEGSYNQIYLNKHTGSWDIIGEKDLFDDEGLSIKRSVSFSTYYSSFFDKKYFGFTLSTKLKYDFNWDKDYMTSRGISCADLPDNDGRLHASRAAVLRYIEARGLSMEYNKMIGRELSGTTEFTVIKNTMQWQGY